MTPCEREKEKTHTLQLFVDDLMQLSNEAHLSLLPTAQLMVLRITSGGDNDHLICKLLEMANQVLEDVKKKIAFWEVAKITKNITRNMPMQTQIKSTLQNL